MRFVLDPYLPDGQVKMIIAGDGLRAYEKSLKSLGVSVLYAKKADRISVHLQRTPIWLFFRSATADFYSTPGKNSLPLCFKKKARNVRSEARRRTDILWTCHIMLSKSEKR